MINKMLNPVPLYRIDIDELIESQYFRGPEVIPLKLPDKYLSVPPSTKYLQENFANVEIPNPNSVPMYFEEEKYVTPEEAKALQRRATKIQSEMHANSKDVIDSRKNELNSAIKTKTIKNNKEMAFAKKRFSVAVPPDSLPQLQ